MSYELMVHLQDKRPGTSLTRQSEPSVGYRFFLSANGSYGHHMLIHKEGRFIAAVREDGAYNLDSALALNGGPEAFREVTSSADVSMPAATAFQQAVRSPSRHFLVQAVVTDIARAARQDQVLHYIVKFLNRADLGVFCALTNDGIRILDANEAKPRELIRVTAPRSPALIESLGMYAALEPR